MYKDINTRVNNIIKQNKIKNIEDLKIIIKYWRECGNNDADIKQTLKDMNFVWQIKTVDPDSIIDVILHDYDLDLYHKIINNIVIYKLEVEKLLQIKNKDVRKIMYCFLVYSKMNDHISGWIRYNKEFIFELCGISERHGNSLISSCCKNGLELRVIGTKHSLICFHLDFKRIDGEIAFVIDNYSDIIKKYNENIGGIVE